MSALDHGPQPLDALMDKWRLGNHDLVEISTEQLTHKQVQKARKGRQMTLKMMMKVNRTFNITIWHKLNDEQKEAFVEYGHKDYCDRISQFILRCVRPKSKKYPTHFQHVGDHLRAKRIDLGWDQARMGRFLNVEAGTVLNWEMGRQTPFMRYWPRIIEFLGYDPGPEPKGLAGLLLQWRCRAGLTQGRAAEAIGVRRNTWRSWESGTIDPSPDARGKIEMLLAGAV